MAAARRPHLALVPDQDPDGGAARKRMERQIVGAAILDADVLEVLDGVGIDTFTDPRLQVVWTAIRNGAKGIVEIESAIEKSDTEYERHQLEQIGGVAFLGDLLFELPAHTDGTASFTRTQLARMGGILEDAQRERDVASSDEIQAFARRDEDTPEERAALEAERAQRRLVDDFWPPLGAFLGDDEPDDDDREDWMIRDLIPRAEPVLWGGPMKSGKTWAALDICLAIALGQDWLGCENTFGGPAKVAGLFLEDGKRRLRKRLWELCRARGVTPNDPRIQENLRLSRKPLRLPSDHAAFVKRTKPWGPKVIVVDNLTRVMLGDPNSTKDASAFTAAWLQLGDELDAAIVFLHHMKKLGQGDDDKRGDPFDAMRGSSDFGAAARNLIASIPLRVDGEHISELRIRGNLDLRREGFILGFERKELLGKFHAKLVDRGEISAIKTELITKKKEETVAKRKAELAAQMQFRRTRATELCRTRGSVSGASLANACGVSPNTALAVLKDMAVSGVFKPHKSLGFVFTDADLPSSVDAPPRGIQPSLGGL